MDSPISISFSVSDNYSQHLAVVLTSVLANNPSSRFVFHVSHRDTYAENTSRRRELERMSGNDKGRIIYSDVDQWYFDIEWRRKLICEKRHYAVRVWERSRSDRHSFRI